MRRSHTTNTTARWLLALLPLCAGVAGASDTKSREHFDDTIVYCIDVDSYPVTPPEWKRPQAPPDISANNSFSPLPGTLLRRLKVKGSVFTPATIQRLGIAVETLTPPRHGKVVDMTPPDKIHETHMADGKKSPLPLGTTSYHYAFMPDLGYLGRDRAAYAVQAKGKRYRVVVNFLVVPNVANSGPSQCSKEKFGD